MLQTYRLSDDGLLFLELISQSRSVGAGAGDVTSLQTDQLAPSDQAGAGPH